MRNLDSKIKYYLDKFAFVSFNDITSRLDIGVLSYCLKTEKLYLGDNVYNFLSTWFLMGCFTLQEYENDLNLILDVKRILEEENITVRFNFCQNAFNCIYSDVEYNVCFHKNEIFDAFGEKLSVVELIDILVNNNVPQGDVLFYCEPLMSTYRGGLSGWEHYLYII